MTDCKEIDKNSLHSRDCSPKLTELQARVLYLLVEEHCKPIEVSRRLKTSRQNVGQIIKRLKKYGVIDKQNLTALQKGGVVTKSKFITTAKWRFHKLHFVIRPFYFEPRYHKQRLERGNIFYSGDWRFVLHEDIVEVQIREFVDFESISKWESLDKAYKSFNRQLNIESNRYGFHVWKDGKANVRICDQHLEEANSGIAKARKDDSYVAIRGFHDDKIYFTFDKSNGLINREYIHSDLAISDSEKFEPFFNSIRYHDIYLPHEVKEEIDNLKRDYINAIKEFTSRMEWMAENNKSHQAVLEDMRDAIKELRDTLKKKDGA